MIHVDLVVAGESIHEAEEFMAGCGIYYEVDQRKRETIFRACSVDVNEIDAESPFSVRFFDEYDVGQPFRVLHFSDAPAWRSLPTFSLITFCLFGAKLLLFCLTGLKDGLTFSL